jgi:predicted RNase H-like HicB family nuclease
MSDLTQPGYAVGRGIYPGAADPAGAIRVAAGLRRDLTVILRPDDLDGGWVASVPSRPGMFAQGATAAEALRSMADLVADEIDDASAERAR